MTKISSVDLGGRADLRQVVVAYIHARKGSTVLTYKNYEYT